MSAGRAITVSRDVDAPAQAVWDVLSDGWLYPLWVVGATRMRDVEAAWPAVGSRLHHSVGVWPLVIDDHTEVLEVEERRMLRLEVRVWPSGADACHCFASAMMPPGGDVSEPATDTGCGCASSEPPGLLLLLALAWAAQRVLLHARDQRRA